MTPWRITLAALCLLAASACGMKQAYSDTEAKVTLFHADLDAERYAEIWKATAPEFRTKGTEEDFEKLLAAVHRKLGKVVSTKQTGWNMNTNPKGTFILVNLTTRFEKGDAQETFTFQREGEQIRLLGYNINSNALIVG